MTNLTPMNESNAREIEMMVGKAMCAWANWQQERDGDREDRTQKLLIEEGHRSEYEATVRILSFFVKESLPQICEIIIKQAKAMMAA